ncbi:MAG: hypothetical protein NTX21_09160 [Alphaproteobacteria bacterium]|nr:hypothetical protein [Alphaproteobacteria bacterium]
MQVGPDGAVYVLTDSGTGNPNPNTLHVQVGPDGAVYVLTDSGTGNPNPNTPWTSKLLRLTPK